jgi:hypothetical protein
MTANQFIEDWMTRNPDDCARLARAALRAYCLDRDMDTSKAFINLEKQPDLQDVDRVIINAIRKTTFMKEAERSRFLWTGCSGMP